MLLHIGNGKTVRGEEIIGIFDLDNATIAKDSRTYLSRATKAGEVSYADSDIPRAFVVTAARSAPSARVILSVARPDPDAPHRPSGSASFHSAQDDTFGVGARSRTAAGVPQNEQGEFRGFAAKQRRNFAAESRADFAANPKEKRPRHPARAKKQKSPPPSQWVHLSHVSSTALHARTERPFDED